MSLDIKVKEGSDRLPLICQIHLTRQENTYTHVQIHHLTVLFPFFCVNYDITRCCNGSLSANTLPFLQEGRDIWTFPRVQGGGVGEAHPEVECKYLAYFLNKRDWIVPQEYLRSCPGDHQPGSAHQDRNYTQRQKKIKKIHITLKLFMSNNVG